jgi:hypothetical protein
MNVSKLTQAFFSKSPFTSPFTSKINPRTISVRTFYFTPKPKITTTVQTKWNLFTSKRSFLPEEEERRIVMHRTMYGWQTSILKPIAFVVSHHIQHPNLIIAARSWRRTFILSQYRRSKRIPKIS